MRKRCPRQGPICLVESTVLCQWNCLIAHGVFCKHDAGFERCIGRIIHNMWNPICSIVKVQLLIGLLSAHLCLGMVDRVVRDRTEVSKYEAQSLQRIECWQQCYNISLFSYIVLHAICNIMACRTKSLLCQFNPTVMVANWRSWWMYPDVSSTQPTVLIKDFV